MAEKYVVCRVEDILDGERIIVQVNNHSIGVFNVGGKYYGILNRCPHMGAALCEGNIVGALSSRVPGDYEYDSSRPFLSCPWHGWEFDIETGRSYIDPKGLRTRRFAIERKKGETVESSVASGEFDCTPWEYAVRHQHDEPDASGRVPGPYAVETVQISVEDDYLVMSLRPERPLRPAAETS